MDVDQTGVIACAREMVRVGDEATLTTPPSAVASLSVADAYRVSCEVVRLRELAGWGRVGRKIGFTNREMLRDYAISEPMFGYMYDRTVRFAEFGSAEAAVEVLVTNRAIGHFGSFRLNHAL